MPMLAAGLLLGAAARLFDIYCQMLGAVFSQMSVWILLGTLISVYSPSRGRHAKYSPVLHGNAAYLLCDGHNYPRGLQLVVYPWLDGVCTSFAGHGMLCMDGEAGRRAFQNHWRGDRARFDTVQRAAL